MKKIKLFSLLFFFTMMGTMFTGCSSSDDDDDEIVNNGNYENKTIVNLKSKIITRILVKIEIRNGKYLWK